MFCDACGNSLQPDQAFCSKCGKQIVGGGPFVPSVRGRVQQHIHLVAILCLAISAFNVIGGLILLVIGNTFFPHLHQMGAPEDVPTGFLSTLVSSIGIIVLAKAACGFLAGWGLMHREPWARVLALVLAFISLFNVPFGTAVGVYTMWVLLPGQSQQEYDAMAATQAA